MKTISKLKRKSRGRLRVQQRRYEARLSLRELAKYTGISKATLGRVESGKEPTLSNALRLARFYETTVEDLFGSFGRQEKPNGR